MVWPKLYSTQDINFPLQTTMQIQMQMQIRIHKQKFLLLVKDEFQMVLQRIIQSVAKIPLEVMVKFVFCPGISGQVPEIQFSNGSLTYLGERFSENRKLLSLVKREQLLVNEQILRIQYCLRGKPIYAICQKLPAIICNFLSKLSGTLKIKGVDFLS